MISRIEVASPPGVSISRMTKGLPRRRATSSPCSMYCAVAGPIALRISRPTAAAESAATFLATGAGAILPALLDAAGWRTDAALTLGWLSERARPSAIRIPRAPVSGPRIDVGLVMGCSRLLSARGPWGARQAGVLRPESAVPPVSPGGRRAGSLRLRGRHQLLPAVADEVRASHAPQRLPQQRPVVGIVIAQERLVQPAHLEALRHPHLAARAAQALQRVLSRVIHRGRRRHGRGQERLHLIGAEAVPLQPQGELQHVLIARTRVGRDEVGNEVLLLAGLARVAVEQRLEAVVGADARLHHHRQGSLRDRLRGDLEVAARMMLGQLLHVLRRLHGEVVAHAGGDEHLADPRKLAHLAVEMDQGRVIGVEIGTDPRIDARRPAAGALDLPAAAGEPIHVGRGAAEVGDDTGETRHPVPDRLDLLEDGALGAALDHTPLVLRDGAEGATAFASTLDGDREADHL